MPIDADLLAKQVDLAYDFIDVLHRTAIDVIREVEAQLTQARGVRCIRSKGYGYYTNWLTTSIARPQAQVADSFAVYLRKLEDKNARTPFDGNVPPIAFLKIVLHEPGLKHPEVRFGLLTNIKQMPGRSEKKFEDIAYRLSEQAFAGPACIHRGAIHTSYHDAYVFLNIEGHGVRLADLVDSKTIAEKIVEPLSELFLSQEESRE
ncbi:MAG: hypothetical protein ACP5HS_06360 [Anaerolineae bacterium]